MVIAHNITAMNAQRQFNIVGEAKKKNTEKLSSGYRINRAADDAAGLAISEKMRRQIRGLNQGAENIQDGISTCQIADGALGEVQDILHRMTELSVKAANGTLSQEDRAAIEDEIKQLRLELDRTTDAANFNEKPLLKAGEINLVPTPSTNSGKADVIFVIDDTGSMSEAINNVVRNLNAFAEGLSSCNVQYGVVRYGELAEAGESTFPFTTDVSNLQTTIGGLSAHGGGDLNESALEAIKAASDYSFRDDATREVILITDAPYHDRAVDGMSAYSTADIKSIISDKNIRLSVVTNPAYVSYYSGGIANGATLNLNSNFHDSLLKLANDIAENAGEKLYKNPEDIRIQMSGEVDDFYMIHTFDVSIDTLGLRDFSCLTAELAKKGIDQIKGAMETVSRMRSIIGADQNALEHSYNVNLNSAENTTAAESAIRDTDMVKEMVEFSKQRILEQAGQSMLAQANQSNQAVLSLLQ